MCGESISLPAAIVTIRSIRLVGSASGDVADDERFVADCVQDHKGVGNAGDIYDEHDYLKEKKEAIEVLEAAVLKIVR